jgi:DNA transformation protein
VGIKGDKMTADSGNSAEFLQNKLTKIGNIKIKKMFGGHGIFEEDKMFALIDSKGTVFFKTDDTNLSRFEEAGSVRHAKMPYYSVPEDVLNDDELLQEWAQVSIRISKS